MVAVAMVVAADALDNGNGSSSSNSGSDSSHSCSSSISNRDDTHTRNYQLQGIIHKGIYFFSPLPWGRASYLFSVTVLSPMPSTVPEIWSVYSMHS